MKTISVVLSVWNAQNTLEIALNSVKWADEIIVIDNSSTDNTPAIAKKYTNKIFRRPNNPMLNVNKNYGFTKATGDWILSLDSDEELSKEITEEIKDILRVERDITGYWLPRKNIIFGKWIAHGLWWPDKQLRLFVRGKGKFPEKHVHEYLEVDGPTADLSSAFIHYNYDSISQFLRKMEYYTDSEVNKLTATNYQYSWFDAVRFPLSDFVKIYFAQECYKDGLHGLVISLLQSFYSLVVFAKLWEKNKFKEQNITQEQIDEELSRTAKEVKYWQITSRLKQTSNFFDRVKLKFSRKLINQ